jgi:hypothetical protein
VRRLALIGVVPAIAVAAPGATAKGVRMDARVCGAVRCTTVTGLEARVTQRYGWLPAPSPMRFYTVRPRLPRGVTLPGLSGTIVYLPERGTWRVRLEGVYLWLEVPYQTDPILRRTVRTLRPCPPSATWVCRAA